MTIDLGQTNIEAYLDGILPTNAGVRITLTSTYSNRDLLVDVDATATIYDEWYKLEFTNEDFSDKAVEGYYILTVDYFTDSWVEFNRYLVKAINSDNSMDVPDSYVSDNEGNQRIVYLQE